MIISIITLLVGLFLIYVNIVDVHSLIMIGNFPGALGQSIPGVGLTLLGLYRLKKTLSDLKNKSGVKDIDSEELNTNAHIEKGDLVEENQVLYADDKNIPFWTKNTILNFVYKLITGNLSLVFTFWIYYFLIGILFVGFVRIITGEISTTSLIFILCVGLVLRVSSFVAVWISSGKYLGRKFWIYLTRLLISVESIYLLISISGILLDLFKELLVIIIFSEINGTIVGLLFGLTLCGLYFVIGFLVYYLFNKEIRNKTIYTVLVIFGFVLRRLLMT